MRKILSILLFTLILGMCSSCAVLSSLLGWDECSYPECDRLAEENSNYCAFHSYGKALPDNFDKQTGKVLDKKLQQHRNMQKIQEKK